MEETALTITRFYYPVQVRGADNVLVHYAYENDSGERGVGVYAERGEPIIFPQRAKDGAIALCQILNARESKLPASLPGSAMRFFFQYGQSNGKL